MLEWSNIFLLLYWHFRLLYAIKTWENIKKSTFFQEYGRLLPWTADQIQPFLISWLQNLVWRKESESLQSLETGDLQYLLVTWEKNSSSWMQQIDSPWGGLLVIIERQFKFHLFFFVFVYINICEKVLTPKDKKYVPSMKIKHFIHTP